MIAFSSSKLHLNAAVCFYVAVAGCVPQTIQNQVENSKLQSARLDWSDWALALSRSVVEDRVDYRKLLARPGAINRTMAMLAQVGPDSTPSQFTCNEDRLAYYINAYNATVVRSVMALEDKGQIPRNAPWGLESRYRFKIDGEMMTPAQLRERAIRCAGTDYRVRFALCDGKRTGPPLHPRPLIGSLLDGQLNFVTRMALYSPDVLRIEIGGERRLYLWEGLFDVRESMIQEYEHRTGTSDASILNVLGEWSNRKRRVYLSTAIGYIITRMPNDDLINQVDPPPAKEGVLSLF